MPHVPSFSAGAQRCADAARAWPPTRPQLRARVAQLWQTRLLRYSKLTVADEIENALSLLRNHLLARSCPKLYANLEAEPCRGQAVHSFLRMGQWIGWRPRWQPQRHAPHTLELALRRQSEVALRHYLTEVHYLGGELSMSGILAKVSPAMQALADASPDTNPHRQDEPYRRALTGMLRAAGRHLDASDRRVQAARHAVAAQNPYAQRSRVFGTICRRHRCLAARATTARRWPLQRLRPLIRAVQVFGFHLATVDLRQSSDKHEAVVAELLRTRAHRSQLRQPGRSRHAAPCCSACCADARPSARGGRAVLRSLTRSEMAIFETAQHHAASATGARPSATTSSATPKP